MNILKSIYTEVNNTVLLKYTILFLLLFLSFASIALKVILMVEKNPFFYTQF